MKENNIKIELTPIKTEHLTKELEKHFKNLGNFMGDVLILLEIHAIKGRNAREIAQIRSLIDKHGAIGDEILNHCRVSIINHLNELFIELSKIS